MSPVEIMFVVLGVFLLIASCFFTGDKESEIEISSELSEAYLEFQKKEIEKYVEHILTEKEEEIIVKTDDYLSKVSNEKIMSVNDFTSQILEKIDFNHKEVVFLYDMLNQKEDEIKKLVKELDAEKSEVIQMIEKVNLLVKQRNFSENPQNTAFINSFEKLDDTIYTGKQAVKMIESARAIEHRLDIAEKEEDSVANQQKEKILQLYKQGMSILEISKALQIGQGEVKLIIGLYI